MVSASEFLKAGGKLPKSEKRKAQREESDRLALEIVGMLAKASGNRVRRQALKKALTMMERGKRKKEAP